MSKVYKITDYKPLLNPQETEQGIKKIKDFFQQNLATGLKLRRVTGPLFVLRGTGINDDLNGVERPVTFPIKDLGDQQAEVVHSLAKWKRLTLAEYHISPGYGIYTDMNAIRADEELDNLHSLRHPRRRGAGQPPLPLRGPVGLGAGDYRRAAHGGLPQGHSTRHLCRNAENRVYGV